MTNHEYFRYNITHSKKQSTSRVTPLVSTINRNAKNDHKRVVPENKIRVQTRTKQSNVYPKQ